MNSNKLGWSYIQSVQEMTVGRYFEYDSEAYDMFENRLGFLRKENLKVLEMGSGSGYFTDILLELFPKIQLTCLEPDVVLIEELKRKFSGKADFVNEVAEKTSFSDNTFDCIISHIVIHNLADPVEALKEMRRIVKDKGKVVSIDPLPASRQFYPTDRITDAKDLLWKAQISKSMRFFDQQKPKTSDPWNYCYAKAYTEAGLRNIQNFGWTSVFTLSDKRFDFDEKKKWNEMRIDLLKSKRKELTSILLELGEKIETIEATFTALLDYYSTVAKSTEEEISTIHEQEIVHRIIVIGEK